MADALGAPEWRQIQGFPAYEVSDDGRVRRTTPARGGWTNRPVPYLISLNLKRRPYISYYSVSLTRSGKAHHITVHRIMALTFLGPPPTPLCQVAHNDGNSLNNTISNLRWATCLENQHDRFKHGTSSRGEGHGASKVTAEQVREIRLRRAAGERNRDLAAIYGIHENTISNIVHRRKWGHVP